LQPGSSRVSLQVEHICREPARVKPPRAALFAMLAMAPPGAHAQQAIFTGTLTCGATQGHEVPAGTDGITILSRNYQGTYTHQMASAGPAFADLYDYGRGNLVGLELTLKGGATAKGVTLATTIQASSTGRTYVLKATQTFSGKNFPRPAQRTCKGIARLVIG
jgi:hypothetical protein